MSSVEVLLATMKRTDSKFIANMNIETDIVIANQADSCGARELSDENGSIKFVVTNSCGVGRNRNLALAYSSSDYCLFADDDMVYVKGYAHTVQRAFQEIGQADVIIFNCKIKGKERSPSKHGKKIKRVRLWNFARYGTCQIGIRRSSWSRNPVYFTEIFGGGTLYGSGEDTLFLRECLRHHMKIYEYPAVVAKVYQYESTWFKGYNAKYFYDKGALLRAVYPVAWIPAILYFSKYWRLSDLSYAACLHDLFQGAKGFKKLKTYETYSTGGGTAV